MTSLLLAQRLVWWLAGFALPAKPALALHLRHALWAMVCAVAGGVMIAAISVAAIVGLYQWFVMLGTPSVTAYVGLMAIALIITGTLLWRASVHIARLSGIKQETKLFSAPAPREPEGFFGSVLSAFMEGLSEAPDTTSTRSEHQASDPHVTNHKERKARTSNETVQNHDVSPSAFHEAINSEGMVTQPISYPEAASIHSH